MKIIILMKWINNININNINNNENINNDIINVY